MAELQTLSLRDLQLLIGSWGDETFPDATPDTVMAHLLDEVHELGEQVEIRDYLEDLTDELADVAILTMQLAHRLGIGLAAAVEAKHARNLARTWVKDDAAGYWRHREAS